MTDRRITPGKVAEIIVLGAICGVLFLLFMPNIEQSRNEARLAQAYIDVRRLHASVPIPATEIRSSERDPWGEPYRIQPLPDGSVRVLSTGPNQSTAANGPDGDDVSSEMSESPARAISRRTQRRLLATFGCAVGAWLVGSALILRSPG